MKTKSLYLILIIVLLIGAVSGLLFSRPGGVGALFSQSINSAGADAEIPATQSLDKQMSGEATLNRTQEIKDLEQELLKTENDPDKALEIRRRIQILRDENQKNAK